MHLRTNKITFRQRPLLREGGGSIIADLYCQLPLFVLLTLLRCSGRCQLSLPQLGLLEKLQCLVQQLLLLPILLVCSRPRKRIVKEAGLA